MIEQLPIDPLLKNDLRQALRGRFPQTVLLSGPAGSGKTALARELAAALLCTSNGDRPCGSCLSCRKVQDNIHPDCIAYDLDDPENRKVDAARRLRREAQILPNEADRKVFLIKNAHTMNVAAQNALLKMLEEPPRYCFFILLSDNPTALLETIRSRCTQYRLAPAAAQTDETNAPLLAPYLTALADADEAGLMHSAVALEKLSRQEMRALLGLLQVALRDAALAQSCAPLASSLASQTALLSKRISTKRILKLYDLAGTLSARVDLNAASAALSCALTAEAIEILH